MRLITVDGEWIFVDKKVIDELVISKKYIQFTSRYVCAPFSKQFVASCGVEGGFFTMRLITVDGKWIFVDKKVIDEVKISKKYIKFTSRKACAPLSKQYDVFCAVEGFFTVRTVDGEWIFVDKKVINELKK